jgi:hypothetical protein
VVWVAVEEDKGEEKEWEKASVAGWGDVARVLKIIEIILKKNLKKWKKK